MGTCKILQFLLEIKDFFHSFSKSHLNSFLSGVYNWKLVVNLFWKKLKIKNDCSHPPPHSVSHIKKTISLWKKNVFFSWNFLFFTPKNKNPSGHTDVKNKIRIFPSILKSYTQERKQFLSDLKVDHHGGNSFTCPSVLL